MAAACTFVTSLTIASLDQKGNAHRQIATLAAQLAIANGVQSGCGNLCIYATKVQLPYWALIWFHIQCLNKQLTELPPLAIANLGPDWPKSPV